MGSHLSTSTSVIEYRLAAYICWGAGTGNTKRVEYLNSLNQEQLDAVTAKIGPVRVLAGPVRSTAMPSHQASPFSFI